MRAMILRRKPVPALLLAVLIGPAWAQAIPDAGQTVRELERPNPATQVPPKDAPHLTVMPERPAMSAADDARIAVRAFSITGATSFSDAELTSLLAEWTGRELSLAELQAAAARITRFYRERGFPVARAYVPAQTLDGGTVEIAVLEGRLGTIELRNASRVSDAQVQALLGQARPGEAIRTQNVERGLLLLGETPGIARADAALQPGASVGLSNLVVALEPAAPVSGAIDIDTNGNRYTGAHRFGGTMYLNSPLRLGDQFTARAVISDEQLYYGRVAYRVPVGGSGLAIGAGYSDSRYELGGSFAPLDVHGSAHIATAFASYPLLRSPRFSLTAALSYDYKTLQDKVGSVGGVIDKSVRAITAGLVGNGQAGSTGYNFSLSYTGGRLDIESAEARAADALSARSQGDYGKLAYAASALTALGGPWSVYGGINGQFSNKNLDSSEKFSLGGADGVRAYPQGEAPADEGYVLSAELRYALNAGTAGAMQLAAFLDHGGIHTNHNPFAAGDNTRRLSAAGLAWNWNAPGSILVRLALAWRAGSTLPTAGADRSPRTWLQAVKYF